MKLLPRHLLPTRALVVAGVTALLAAAATPAKAVLLVSSPLVLPTMLGTSTNFYFLDPGNGSDTRTSQDLGLFQFSDPTDIPSLLGIQITISLQGLDTQSPGFDNSGDIDLTLNGIDTGIQMNGFKNGSNSVTVTGADFDPTTAAAIYNSFLNGGYTYNSLNTQSGAGSTFTNTNPNNGIPVGTYTKVVDSGVSNYTGYDDPTYTTGLTTTAGQLVAGLILTQDPSGYSSSADSGNPFSLIGGTAQLMVSDQLIPFTPSEYLGFGLIALALVLWQIPQTNGMMRRLLVRAA